MDEESKENLGITLLDKLDSIEFFNVCQSKADKNAGVKFMIAIGILIAMNITSVILMMFINFPFMAISIGVSAIFIIVFFGVALKPSYVRNSYYFVKDDKTYVVSYKEKDSILYYDGEKCFIYTTNKVTEKDPTLHKSKIKDIDPKIFVNELDCFLTGMEYIKTVQTDDVTYQKPEGLTGDAFYTVSQKNDQGFLAKEISFGFSSKLSQIKYNLFNSQPLKEVKDFYFDGEKYTEGFASVYCLKLKDEEKGQKDRTIKLPYFMKKDLIRFGIDFENNPAISFYTELETQKFYKQMKQIKE